MEYIMTYFNKNSKLYFTQKDCKILEEIREGEKTPYRYYLLVQTPFGVCKVRKQEWGKGKLPTIQTALNKK